MPDLAVSAPAHAALHVTFERHEDAIIADAFLRHLFDHEAIHHRRSADGAIGVIGVDLEILEGLGDQADVTLPIGMGLVDREVEIEIGSVTPHLELLAEHDLFRAA